MAQTKKNNKKTLLIIGGIVIVLAVGGGVGGYFVNQNHIGILSYKFTGYEYICGGAHGMAFYRNYMFDLSTGYYLDLDDIVAISEDEFHQKVVDAFTELVNQNDPTINLSVKKNSNWQ